MVAPSNTAPCPSPSPQNTQARAWRSMAIFFTAPAVRKFTTRQAWTKLPANAASPNHIIQP